MRRREFIAVLGGVAAAWPLEARAQHAGKSRRIGWFVGLAEQDPEARNRNAVLVGNLENFGWTVGRNLAIDYRYTTSTETQTFDVLAKELIALSPDVLLANSTPTTRALQRVTATIPIVFGILVDPIGSGVVRNLARPGGNVTGFTSFEPGMGSKWLDFLKAFSPGIAKVALIYNPNTAPYEGIQRSIEAAAPPFGIEIASRGVNDVKDLETVIEAAGRAASIALIVFPDLFATAHQDRIIALAAQYKVPAIYPYRYIVANGGLMSYGVDTPDTFRRMAGYVDRILNGEKPGDLPVQEPNKFDLVINLKTAKALGLTVPDKLLALADEVIE
jgi:putative tryptophan/tyrosine transport system substrate-binding protein